MKKYLAKWFVIIIVIAVMIGAGFLTKYMPEETKIASVFAEEQASETAEDQSYFRISIPDKYEGAVQIEENLMEKTVRIALTGITEFSFSTILIEENDDRVVKTERSYENGEGTLLVYLDGRYACEGASEGRMLSLRFTPVREKYDRILVIDPGHGGEADTGTIAYGYEEKDLTLALAKEVKALLESELSDSYVCLTRLGDTALSERERESFAKELGADFYISIHMDADPSSRATTGVSTYYNSADVRLGRAYAEIMQSCIAKAIEGQDADAVKEDEKVLTKEFPIPALVVEAGYLTNKQEARMLGTKEYREILAAGIAAGIEKIVMQK